MDWLDVSKQNKNAASVFMTRTIRYFISGFYGQRVISD